MRLGSAIKRRNPVITVTNCDQQRFNRLCKASENNNQFISGVLINGTAHIEITSLDNANAAEAKAA